MGSCENSLEVEVVREPLHQTAVEQQNGCLIKVLGSEQAQLPCSEDGFDLSNGDNVGAAGVLRGCAEFYKIDNSGCASLEGASVVDKGIGLVSENGNADSSVPGKFSEDRMVGCNLYERQSGTDDCSTQMDGLCMGKLGSSVKNFALANSPEHCEQSLMEGASVDKGIGMVSDNVNVVHLGSGKLSKDECGFIGGNLNERQSGIDDCSVETDQLCVEKLGSSDENYGLTNSLKDCVVSLDLVPVSGSPENHDEQDQQNDGRSGTVQGDMKEKSDGLAATDSGTCDQMGASSDCEVSAELRPMNSFPTNEFDQDKQQGSSTSLETILVVMGNKSVGMSGTENDDHNQIQSLLVDHESMPQLRPTTDPLVNYVQQDDQIINSPSAEGDMNEKSNISPVIEATNCNQLVLHQGFNESLELKPLIGSPGKSVQQDEPKFVGPVCSYSHEGMMENKSDHLAVEKTTVDNQILSSVVNKTFMESDSCSGLAENCCQQNDLKTKSESTVSLGTALDGKNDVLAALDSFTCTQKSLHITEMPEKLGLQVSICDMHDDQKKEKDVNCVTAESVPTGILEKNDLDGCIEACPPQADSLSNYDQNNEQRDDKSVSGPFAETMPDAVEEGSDVTTEIKVEICRQEFPLEGDAYDLKERSPKIALTSRLSCQSLGVSGNSSSRDLEPQHLIGKDVFSVICSGNAVDCSEQTNNREKDLAINDCPSTTGCPEIRSSSSRKSRRTPKSSQKAQTKWAAKISRNKDKVQDLQIFKAERRKRSCFSKPARSSNWGLLGNIAQFFEQSNGLGFKEIQNHEPNQNVAQGARKRNKSRAAGSSLRSSGKRHASTSGIRLKVKVGNEIVQNGLNIMVPEVIDTSASAGVVATDFEAKSYPGTSFEVTNVGNRVEVKMGEEGTEEQLECSGTKLGEARIHYDASVSDFHAANKESEGIVISQKSSGDAEADYLGVPSHVEVETLGAVIEKRYTDPGTSPDSEVINLVPEGQVSTICQDDFPDADAVFNSSKAVVVPGDVPSGKKGKKKGRITQISDFLPEDNSPGMESLNKVKVTKNRGGRQRKGDDFFSSEILTSSTSANASSNSSNNKEFSEEQLPLSRGTELIASGDASPEELSTETKVSSGMDVALMLSGAQNSSKLLHSTKSKGCQRLRKSGGTSKGGSKVSDKARRKREGGSKQRRKERKSLKKNKVKGKPECNDFIYKEEADPEIDASEKSNSYDITASMAAANLNMASSDTLEQHLHVDNAWVRCDGCHKWRRIPVALVDSIGQTNCQWICKDNMDKEFADCSIPQEKSNAEINAELGLSDADEDACDVPSKNKALELCKRTAVPKEHEFTRISTNQFLHRSRKTQTIDEIMVCHCKLPRDGGFGCGDECLNRMLNIECVRGTCPCGDLCSNQQFQKRSYAKMKWDRCGKKGFGLRLEESISKGHFLIEYVGEVLDMHTYEARQREYAFKGHKHFYFMTLNATEVIDACAKGNLGRFINHSCDPNCRTEKWVVNGEICIGLFALRDVKKGEELTFDYNYVRVFGAAAKKCYCGSPQCRGYIGGDPTSTEVIDQVDSDEEFLEPVMLEVGEAGDRMKNRASKTSSFDDVGLQVAESTSNDRDKMDNFTAAATKMEVAPEIGDSMNTSTSDISHLPSSLEMSDLKESFPSSSQRADAATIESSPAVKKEILIEETHRRLETSSTTMASKSSTDVMAESRKPKSEEKRVFVKSRFLIKASRESVCAKKGKISSNALNFNKMMANKSQVLSSKPKKLIDGTTNGRLEAVEGKLNELLDIDGGISKRKDAAKGYLKFLLLTAASGASGNGEAIQSNRDLSMILDALLKTKSRVVLIDIINKNGLRMLHNMLKQYRGDFKKTPILRKLLKVIEYLAAREILTPDHIYGGPPCPGMESFKKSMLSLTEHIDKQVHQIARSFRDRWFPRQGRKYSYMDRDDGRVEFYRGSVSNRISASHNHLHDLAARPTEVIDGAMQPKVATASVDSAVPEGCSSLPVGDGTKTRKRKSRWDQPAEEKPSARSHQHDEQRTQFGLQQSGYNPLPDIGNEVSDHTDNGRRESSGCPHCACNYYRLVQANCADLGRQKSQSDVPPGFSSPLNPALVSSNASSTIADLPNQNGGLMFPVGMVVGHPQRKFISRLSVSYGIPLPIMHQFGSPQDGTVESWKIAPGMPFHPFPPLPPFPHHKNESPSSSAVNSMAIDETAEEGQQRQDSATCYPNAKNPSTTVANQPDMEVPGENGQETYKRARASSQDLGRSYFRQQKWNKKPPWMHHTNGWGQLGSNSKGGICSTTDVGSVTNEPRNSYCSQDVSSRVEKAGDCINHQSST